ncbi:DNA-directed DNA polymerase IV [Aspergillus lucknowensis]|uniref:DNA polymerase n=1 Tax=Aspergillus lucknowensis TaxID=176173 RepID=A0ABR4M640_9EURO
MSRMRADKQSFFSSLEQLECPGDDSEGEFDRLLACSRKKDGDMSSPENTSPLRRPCAIRDPSPDNLAVGAAAKSSQTTMCDMESRTTESVRGSSKPPPASRSSGKRKRGSLGKIIPEHLQIFKGLVFFFFPNNDVSPLRRLRIQRAQEYGARWEKTWGSNITHVIVDKGLKFEDILKHLKLRTFPSNVGLVDECYPAECIKFRCILSITQTRFLVSGATCPSEAEGPSRPSASMESLPLKPDKKQQWETQTPPRISEEQGNPRAEDLEFQAECTMSATEDVVYESFPARERDVLDEMIDEAKAAKHLPLDPLDAPDDDAPTEASDDETPQESEPTPAKRKRRKLSRDDHAVTESRQQKFVCMQKHDSTSNDLNPNARTIEVLQQMLDYYTRTSDHWRSLAYRKAISALRNQTKRVVTGAQALNIPGVGPRLADKIEEIVFTNRLRRLDNTNNTVEERVLQEFLAVYGAGISHASRWVAQGFKTLEDLWTKATLTQSQRIGVERYFDFSQRIPRSEVRAHGEFVRRVVQEESPHMQVIIGGSYRRGAADSGDIDLLITKPDATIEEIRTLMLDIVVPKLFRQGFLQVSLAGTSRDDGSKWHGASKLPNNELWRRIDLLFVPGAELGAALIYFTGNDIFNRSMRLLASKKSMRLNQRGLYAVVLRGPQRAKLNNGRLMESRDERRIFELLGVPWRPPEHRIC